MQWDLTHGHQPLGLKACGPCTAPQDPAHLPNMHAGTLKQYKRTRPCAILTYQIFLEMGGWATVTGGDKLFRSQGRSASLPDKVDKKHLVSCMVLFSA